MDPDLDNSKLVLEVLKLHSRQRLGQNVGSLLICHHILELHCSSLHHIPDIVILDLNVLRLVMEHWVLRQLHTTLVVIEDIGSIQWEIK